MLYGISPNTIYYRKTYSSGWVTFVFYQHPNTIDSESSSPIFTIDEDEASIPSQHMDLSAITCTIDTPIETTRAPLTCSGARAYFDSFAACTQGQTVISGYNSTRTTPGTVGGCVGTALTILEWTAISSFTLPSSSASLFALSTSAIDSFTVPLISDSSLAPSTLFTIGYSVPWPSVFLLAPSMSTAVGSSTLPFSSVSSLTPSTFAPPPPIVSPTPVAPVEVAWDLCICW